jgi:hypothetical protein
MLSRKGPQLLIVLVFVTGVFTGCGSGDIDSAGKTGRQPVIEPDYSDVTIPPNVAPMNFCIKEEGSSFIVIATSATSGYQIKTGSRNGIIRFPQKSWKKLLKNSVGDKIEIRIFSFKKDSDVPEEYNTVYMHVSDDPIDPYLVYRLIYPGYYSWSHIKIVQRSIESFEEKSIFDNEIMEKNCANCHSFNRNSADRFMMHIRGSLGGTYFYEDGKVTRVEPKIDAMPGGATYPSWHPGGRYVAFSSNQVRQSFYSIPEKSIEVFDLVSALVVYDRGNNETIIVTDRDTTKYLQTFPSWSPDGRYLYFCRARQYISGDNPELEQIMKTHYDLARKSFDPESRSFGETEIVFNSSEINKSVSFPRVSPDGKFLVFTLSDYGTFPIWHQEADLYLLDLQSGKSQKMNINSKRTESYHTWSLNGKWLVFSSKRLDGRSARPYFAHIDSLGNQGKEFALPQKDPSLYSRMLESFNIPEFVNGRIKLKPRDLAAASKQEAVKAKSGNPKASTEPKKETVLKENDRPIHE